MKESIFILTISYLFASEIALPQFPFLAHAIGTLSGAFIASKFSASYHMLFAMCIGTFFLIGGISMVFILPAPIWFIIIDLVFAYLPMGWLGWKISNK